MNRRSFLVRSAIACSAALAFRPLLRAQPGPANTATAFKPLRRNVGLFTGRGGTIGWLVNAEAIAAVDTQFPETAAVFLEQLPGGSGRQVDVLFNTHHHGDHVSGNPTFRPVTKQIVAHTNVPELMRQAAARANRPTDNLVIAETTFDTTWRQEVGDEVVSARYFGPAHTRGDIVVTFEQANVVHLGDLLFNRRYPVIDRPGGANIRGWITILEKIATEYPHDALYIFGHSHETNPQFPPFGSRADLYSFRDYLAGLLQHVEREIAAGKTREQIITLENLPGFPEFHVTSGSRLPANLGVAYDELTNA